MYGLGKASNSKRKSIWDRGQAFHGAQQEANGRPC
jgi:hypothetical protein